MIRRLLRPGLLAVSNTSPLFQAPPPPPSVLLNHQSLLLTPYQQKFSSSSTHSDSTTTNNTTMTMTCWKCGREFGTRNGEKVLFFCPCDKRVILPPTVTNYFTILECEAVRVDTDALKRKHTELQRELHPDKFSIKSQEEQEYSAQQSALVNDAFYTLSKPYSRGLYLMELNGITISEADNYVASGDSGKHLEFLEEVMELRGEIHRLENSSDPDLAQVKSLWDKNNAQLQACTREFENCYEKNDLDGAKEALSKMKYYVTNNEMLHPLLPDESI